MTHAILKKPKPTVLFLCTGNSCRSQMAEGWARHLKGDMLEPYSAGIERHGVNPLAVKVMAEVGVDISKQRSQLIEELPISEFDYVITLCSHADKQCPSLPAKTKIIHQGFDDPPKLAKNAVTVEEVLAVYRLVRDEIKDYIVTMPEVLH